MAEGHPLDRYCRVGRHHRDCLCWHEQRMTQPPSRAHIRCNTRPQHRPATCNANMWAATHGTCVAASTAQHGDGEHRHHSHHRRCPALPLRDGAHWWGACGRVVWLPRDGSGVGAVAAVAPTALAGPPPPRHLSLPASQQRRRHAALPSSPPLAVSAGAHPPCVCGVPKWPWTLASAAAPPPPSLPPPRRL